MPIAKPKYIKLEQTPFAQQPEARFINRELSWLAFNGRVLEEAENARHPLLERVRFLAISASNMDEFYMVRVAGLKDQIKEGHNEKSQDGLLPMQQLERIEVAARALITKQQTLLQKLTQELKQAHLHILTPKQIGAEDKEWLHEHFSSNIFPALSLFAVDAAHPFPFLPNLGMALIARLKRANKVLVIHDADDKKKAAIKTLKGSAKNRQAIIPLPSKLPRFVALPPLAQESEATRYILLEDVILMFQEELFPGFDVVGAGMMHITRDSELDISDEAEDLMRHFESALKMRRRGEVIRLLVSADMPKFLKEFVREQLNVPLQDTIEVEGMLGLPSLQELIRSDLSSLLFKPMNIRFPERIRDYGGDCFAAIYAKDIVVHHPYESFDVVVQFLRQAAADPDVIAIKQTLYRTSNDSPIIKTLIEAAEAGKSVTAIVEIKARFDEEANLRWARDLERAGAQVVYGVMGLKTHSKVSLVVRRVEGGLRSYVHYGTGNYHPQTAKVYTDLSLFTCNPALCRDAAHLFNYLTGYAPPSEFEKIAVSPLDMRKKMLKLIEQEKQYVREGKPGSIWIKVNAVVDPEMIDALYAASQAGVQIDIVARGVCCLRPGVPGLSENIRVKSLVGRFLEHARIYCFGNGQNLPSREAKVYISSADLMPRNLNSRVEVMVPLENPTVHQQVLDQIMGANIHDEAQSWKLDSEGNYIRGSVADSAFSAHDFFIKNPSLSGRGKALYENL